MTEPQRPRCPKCDTPNPASYQFCSSCGAALRPQTGWQNPAFPKSRPRPPNAPGSESTPHFFLRWGLIVWAIGYPVISCSPMFIGGADSGGAVAAGGLVSLVLGATLFGPWIVGLLVLGVLFWVTKG